MTVEPHEHITSGARPFQIGDWKVDPMSCRLVSDGVEVSLEPKVMDLLVYLAARHGRVASRTEILDGVWSSRFVVESVLTRAISLLRRGLGDDARSPTYIETIPRRGYRVIAPVRRLEPGDATPGQEPLTPDVPPPIYWILRTDTGRVVLNEGTAIIGRDVDAEVFLDADDVSRHHARITVSGDRAVLEDLGSKNGTLLNGHRVSDPVPLRHLDVIVAATVRLVVHARPTNAETESVV
jgi:DNA-binding winged helix-turn-helix (wHTH) protein